MYALGVQLTACEGDESPEPTPRRDRPSAHMKRASTLITLVHEQLVNHFLMLCIEDLFINYEIL